MKVLNTIVGLEDLRAWLKDWDVTLPVEDTAHFLKVLDDAGKILSKRVTA